MPIRLWLCLLCFLCLPLALAAEVPEAFTIDGDDPGAASMAAVPSWQVSARFEVLRAAPPRLGLPLAAGKIRTAELTGFESRGADSYTWRGRWADGEGSVTLTVHGTELAGFIEADNAVYEIVPQGKQGISSLTLLDTDRFPECATSKNQAVAEIPFLEAGGIGDFAGQPQADSAARIDVMVLYTSTARSAAGGTAAIKAVAQAAVDAANTAYANSQITQRLRLVHAQEVTYNEASGDYYDHLDWLTTDPAVAALRNAYRADLVDLLVQDGEFCGLGWLMNNVSSSFAGSGFTVTTRTCAVGNLSFAHELGHNMGAHHDPANGGGSPAYPYSYGHFVNGSYRTVMSYSTSAQCPAGCTRVAYFSNPNVSYLGHPTGIADARDNHRTLNNTALVVANFRQEIPPADLYTLTPCRVADTRNSLPVLSGVVRVLDVAGTCGIPANATAVVVNVTVAEPTGIGNLVLYPADLSKPNTSVINFAAGTNRANNSILALPGNGSGDLAVEALVVGGGSVHLVLDVTGYMAAPAADLETP
jgi:hypothetical protein